MPVLLAVGAAALVVLAAYAGRWVLALCVVGVQAGLAYGLVGARRLPDRSRSALLVLVSGAGVVLALSLVEPEPVGSTVAPALWVLGPTTVAAVVLGLARRDGRAHLVEATATTASGVALTAMLAMLVPLETLEPLRATGVVLATAGAVVGVAVWWLAAATPAHRWVGAGAAAIVAACACAALGLVDVPGLGFEARLVAGSAVAVTGLVGAGAGYRLADAAWSQAVLMPAVGLALTGPTAYVATRMMLG